MTLPLDKEMLAAAYDYLRTTPPFNRWNLPESEDVSFSVAKTANYYGWYRWLNGKHKITMSGRAVGHTETLMRIMAHEMIHLHLRQTGIEGGGSEDTHNAPFRKFADRVCKAHGFDPKVFY